MSQFVLGKKTPAKGYLCLGSEVNYMRIACEWEEKDGDDGDGEGKLGKR